MQPVTDPAIFFFLTMPAKEFMVL